MVFRLSKLRPRRSSTSAPSIIKGALFDLDGTLVDSEFLSPLAWTSVLHEIPGFDQLGHQEVEDALQKPELRGANASVVATHLLKTFKISHQEDPAELVLRKRAVAVNMVVQGEVDLEPLWFTGVADAIKRLEKVLGCQSIGLCTSNLRPIADATIGAGRLNNNSFAGGKTVQEDVIDPITGLPQIKPNPDPYLLAVKKLSIPSNHVVAFEDSVVGVTSAVSAGVGTVLGVLNRKDNETKESKDVTEALLTAGAYQVFPTTVEAIDWCISTGINDDDIGEITLKPLMEVKEDVVRRYFDGVNQQDADMMSSCFAEQVELIDMCGPSKGIPKFASCQEMADRCMEFLAAHPDCRVEFEQEPVCDRNGQWVWCHWKETGNWIGKSRGIAPQNTPLNVGGHTRFLLEEQPDGSQKIAKQVVYRTFSEWELSL